MAEDKGFGVIVEDTLRTIGIADDEQNISESRGRGWHGDSKKHAEAGRKGGRATAATHGEDFYRKIGRKGGKASPTQFKKGSERAREAGRRGGRA